MSDIHELLSEKASGGYLTWPQQLEIADLAGLSPREVEGLALAARILPERYRRNIQAISREEQYTLFQARVAVIGCGGLGGYVIEELARLGVGSIQAWDYDVFEEHNLNRQLTASVDLIGKSKVKALQTRVKSVNPVIDLQALPMRFDYSTGIERLSGQQVVVDALDNIPTRLVLADVCHRLDLPLVHGAVAGWNGQVCTQFPGEDSLEKLYSNHQQPRGIESEQGVLAFAPALIGSLQAAEIIKILLGREELLRRRVLFINLLDMEMEILEL